MWSEIREKNYIVEGEDIVWVVGWEVIKGMEDEVDSKKMEGGGKEIEIFDCERMVMILESEDRSKEMRKGRKWENGGKNGGGEKYFNER